MRRYVLTFAGPRQQAHHRRHGRRYLHHLQRWCFRLSHGHSNHQPASDRRARTARNQRSVTPTAYLLPAHILTSLADKPVAVNGKVEIRPMMYLALTYDHRLLDGREAVTFLVKIKEYIEDPRKMLLF